MSMEFNNNFMVSTGHCSGDATSSPNSKWISSIMKNDNSHLTNSPTRSIF